MDHSELKFVSTWLVVGLKAPSASASATMIVSHSSSEKLFRELTLVSVSRTRFGTFSKPMRTSKHMPALFLKQENKAYFTSSVLPLLMRSADSRNSMPMPVPHSFIKYCTSSGSFSFTSATAMSYTVPSCAPGTRFLITADSMSPEWHSTSAGRARG